MGLLLSATLRCRHVVGLPGHQFLGGNLEQPALHHDLREAYVEYPNVTIPTTRGSWACSGISIKA